MFASVVRHSTRATVRRGATHSVVASNSCRSRSSVLSNRSGAVRIMSAVSLSTDARSNDALPADIEAAVRERDAKEERWVLEQLAELVCALCATHTHTDTLSKKTHILHTD